MKKFSINNIKNIKIGIFGNRRCKRVLQFTKKTLGDTFKADIKKSIKNIKNFPNLYPNITDDLKRCVLHRFPYSIFFSITNNTILILSVAHQHRKPFY